MCSGLGFFVDPPGGGYGVPAVDRISYVYVAMALLLLGGTALLLRLQGRLQRGRGAVGMALLGGLMVVWIAIFPARRHGPLRDLAARPGAGVFWRDDRVAAGAGRGAAGVSVPGLLRRGLCAVARPGSGRRSISVPWPGPPCSGPPQRQRLVWLYIATCGLVCLALGAKFLLFVGFSNLLGAALLPVAMSEMSSALAATPQRAGLCAQRLHGARAGAAAACCAGYTGICVQRRGGRGGAAYPSCCVAPDCAVTGSAAGQIVLAQVEETPELLYRTQV